VAEEAAASLERLVAALGDPEADEELAAVKPKPETLNPKP